MMKMTKQEFLASSGIHVRTLDLWIEQEWLAPEQTPEGTRFSDIDVARARFIRDLRDDIGANDEGIDVILHLLDQLHGLRRTLAELRDDMKSRQGD
jgi:chaperone modulatory protein CbpM